MASNTFNHIQEEAMTNSEGSDSTRGSEQDPLRHLHGGANETSAWSVELLKSTPTVDDTNVPVTDADIQWHQRHAGRTHLPSPYWTDEERRAIELDALRGVLANEAEYRQLLNPGCRRVLDELKNADTSGDTDRMSRLIHTLHDCIRQSGDIQGLGGACESWPSALRGTRLAAQPESGNDVAIAPFTSSVTAEQHAMVQQLTDALGTIGFRHMEPGAGKTIGLALPDAVAGSPDGVRAATLGHDATIPAPPSVAATEDTAVADPGNDVSSTAGPGAGR